MKYQGKSRRLRERMKLSLPARVQGRDAAGREWTEQTRLVDVTPFGARFTLAHLTEPGRLLLLTLPLPRQLRCFDYLETQYNVWSLVRNMQPQTAAGSRPGAPEVVRFAVGVAFIGKQPPASYIANPTQRYEVSGSAADGMLWRAREVAPEAAGGPGTRSQETRLQMAVEVLIELLDAGGAVLAREETVTENLSRRGAAVWTTLNAERGAFVRVTSLRTQLSLVAVVRARRTGPDGIPRLHLEFVGQEWPLEGVE